MDAVIVRIDWQPLTRKEAENVQAHLDSYGRLEALRSRAARGHATGQEQGSAVTVLYVIPDYAAMIYGAEVLTAYNASELDKSAQEEADKVLQIAVDIAKTEGVVCKTERVMNIRSIRPSSSKPRTAAAI